MTADRIQVGIVGGAGYVGGELLRLLIGHPNVDVRQVTSRSQAGRYVHGSHPNLRGATALQFSAPDRLERVDLLFLAQPHGVSAGEIDRLAEFAPKLVDCSADFRLRTTDDYATWYGAPHPAPVWLPRFVYGLPEAHREEIRSAEYVSGVGCNATVTTLALLPLARAGLLERVVADVKVGSSEAGAAPTATSHHPERSGAVRSFMPTGHRHQAEITRVLGTGFDLDFSVTSVELVRGALVTAHCFVTDELTDADVWRLYRGAYGDEPFVRLVAAKTGVHRFPEPKLLAGSNYCDVGFERDTRPGSNRLVVIAAIDNLMKGAAGTAVQCMNLMLGVDETTGLAFTGLHPI